MEEEIKPKNTLVLSAAVLAVVLALVAGIAALNKIEKGAGTTDESTVVETEATNTPSNSNETATTGYKDGTYTATGSYSTPGGSEQIGVTLTVKDDVVTAADIDAQGVERDSKQYQSQFIGGYKQFVVGKKLSEINLSRVSGSSLTPKGFNAALTKIKSEANNS